MARPSTYVLTGAAGLAVVASVVGWAALAGSATAPGASPVSPYRVPAPPVAAPGPPGVAPAEASPEGAAATATPPDGPGLPAAAGAPARPPAVSPAWLGGTATATGVPVRALQAYAVAATVSAAEDPACGLAWPTLAGIGWVESHHGTLGGRVLDPASGLPSSPVVGVALSGDGVALVQDSDDGVLDGDAALDRAVGPMQFIPSTWARWGSDGDADGRADPQDVDDAALSAARYLCAAGVDLRSAAGWSAALLSYNRSVEYVQQVTTTANTYATRSRG